MSRLSDRIAEAVDLHRDVSGRCDLHNVVNAVKPTLDDEERSERVARLLRRVAAPAVPGEHLIHAISRAARRLGWDRGRTKRLWYGEARRVDADELVAIERLLKLRQEARDEHARLAERIARLEAILVQDEDFHRPQVDAWRAASRSVDSPVGGER